MSRLDETYTTMFECGHTALFRISPPATGEVVYCGKCRDYQLVKYRSSDWRVRCVHCRYSRYLGADQKWAKNRGDKHVRENPTHVVKVFRASNPDEWELIRAEQSELPISIPDSDIPF